MQRTGLNSINNFPNFYLFLVMIFRTSVQNVHHATVQSFYLFGFYPYSVPQCSLQIRTPQGSSTGLHSTLFGCSGLKFLLNNVCCLCGCFRMQQNKSILPLPFSSFYAFIQAALRYRKHPPVTFLQTYILHFSVAVSSSHSRDRTSDFCLFARFSCRKENRPSLLPTHFLNLSAMFYRQGELHQENICR